MKPPSRWLWRVGVALYSASLIVFAFPALAAVSALSIGDVTFGWGHVLMLFGIGAAWQNEKTSRLRDREEQKRDRDEIRSEVREMRSEIKELWSERR